MKNLQKYNVECIENIQIINGGCFAWDAGWAIRSLFSSIGPGALNGIPRAIGEYAAHYAGDNVH